MDLDPEITEFFRKKRIRILSHFMPIWKIQMSAKFAFEKAKVVVSVLLKDRKWSWALQLL